MSPSPDVMDVDDVQRDPAYVQAVKDRRAATLAKRVDSGASHGDEITARRQRYLVIRLGSERYGIALECVEAIRFVSPITPLPGVPSFIAGVICLVGETLTLVDLSRLLGVLAGKDVPDPRFVVVSFDRSRTALRVDGVEGIREFLEVQELSRTDVGGAWLRPEQIHGVADGTVVLLDLPSVLRDRRVRVDQVPAGGGA